eukprot:TRINITY_DN81562_c0_g1_i1.p1 TRINITY_DN81562_c0_g1~~TRINITY_DN81562_c0_g1_i1.p1  ORF type:complete len:303 (-),score=72.66 TRINITY_DN81562_c0_g1_i1:42-830(-)
MEQRTARRLPTSSSSARLGALLVFQTTIRSAKFPDGMFIRPQDGDSTVWDGLLCVTREGYYMGAMIPFRFKYSEKVASTPHSIRLLCDVPHLFVDPKTHFVIFERFWEIHHIDRVEDRQRPLQLLRAFSFLFEEDDQHTAQVLKRKAPLGVPNPEALRKLLNNPMSFSEEVSQKIEHTTRVVLTGGVDGYGLRTDIRGEREADCDRFDRMMEDYVKWDKIRRKSGTGPRDDTNPKTVSGWLESSYGEELDLLSVRQITGRKK